MTTLADYAAEARSWEGTPFHWQASLKGVGCDCRGLIVGAARALGLPEADGLWAGVADYGARVPVAKLKQGLRETLEPFESVLGAVLLMKVAGVPQHLGIHAGTHVIHAYSAGPKKRTLATPLDVSLRAWPLDSAWRFRSLEA